MKIFVNQLLCFALSAMICAKTNAAKEIHVLQSLSAPNKPFAKSGISRQASGIVGDWKLALETYDENHNKQLDDAERKKGFSNHYFYRFSSDGSCIISPFANNQLKSGFKGKYKIDGKNGKQVLTTFWDETDQKGQREGQYTIISVNENELVLLETTGDHTFWIFKRVG
jgi:lipocalin-like protein